MAETTLKIHGARFIMTLDPERRIIQDGSIIVEGQRIIQVGKATELESVKADRVIDGSEMVVTPGFCNGHMHISYAHATRGVFPDDLGASYLPNVFKLQGEMTEEEEYSNPLNLPVSSTAEAISMMDQTIQSFDNRLDGRMRAWAMPFSPSFSTEELLRGAKELADRYGTGLTLHFNNSPQAVEASLSQHGKRPAEYLEDIGVLGPSTLLAHCLGIDQGEVDVMARTGTKAVMCPTAAIKGGAGMTRTALLPELLRAGVTVGLGTDAGNNSNLVETMRSMYLAAVLYKDGREDVGMIPAETALEMATIKGAEALGLGDEIGSIEPGKKADLVLFDTKRPEWRTIFNPVNNLVYNADGRSVHTVIIDGKVVVENHEPLFVDQWELIQRVQKLGEGLLARTGISFPSRWPIV